MKKYFYDKSSEDNFSKQKKREDTKVPLYLDIKSKRTPLYKPLFSSVQPVVQHALEIYPQIVEKVIPLSYSHRLELPHAIHELSSLLTSKRNQLQRSYWSSPRFIAAYLWYFLPWNLIRLTRLFSGVSLPAITAKDIVMDLGSGPLTVPLSLWLSQPVWRQQELTLLCVDTSYHPMTLGLELLKNIAIQLGQPLKWRIKLIRKNFFQVLHRVNESIKFCMFGNVLNELKERNRNEIASYMERVTTLLRNTLHSNGSAIFIEPGTRFGGKILAMLREVALEEGLISVSPCTHHQPCPLLKKTAKMWCHIVLEAEAPRWLSELSQKARLSKSTLSFSFQLLQHKRNCPTSFFNPEQKCIGRIISEAFSVPNMGEARYVCTNRGLALLPYAHEIPFGAAIAYNYPKLEERDPVSGALKISYRTDRYKI